MGRADLEAISALLGVDHSSAVTGRPRLTRSPTGSSPTHSWFPLRPSSSAPQRAFPISSPGPTQWNGASPETRRPGGEEPLVRRMSDPQPGPIRVVLPPPPSDLMGSAEARFHRTGRRSRSSCCSMRELIRLRAEPGPAAGLRAAPRNAPVHVPGARRDTVPPTSCR
jgi:hypothetical protein